MSETEIALNERILFKGRFVNFPKCIQLNTKSPK